MEVTYIYNYEWKITATERVIRMRRNKSNFLYLAGLALFVSFIGLGGCTHGSDDTGGNSSMGSMSGTTNRQYTQSNAKSGGAGVRKPRQRLGRLRGRKRHGCGQRGRQRNQRRKFGNNRKWKRGAARQVRRQQAAASDLRLLNDGTRLCGQSEQRPETFLFPALNVAEPLPGIGRLPHVLH